MIETAEREVVVQP